MPFQIIHQDITKIKCDAIVNPTDCLFSGSGGTDHAVHTAAGTELDEECKTLSTIGFGEVTVTNAYALPCKHIIHTVGPVWAGGGKNEAVLLRSCYINALLMAHDLKARSVAVPLISAGTFGFPKDMVLKIALSAISDFLSLTDADMDVALCVYDKTAYEISRKLELERYLKHNSPFYERIAFSPRKMSNMDACRPAPAEECMPMASMADMIRPSVQEDDLPSWIKKQDDSFTVMLLKLIDKKGMTDVECYKKANVSKGTFWKIMNVPDYKPSKVTVISFAIALRLTLEETESFLKTAGFSLSHSNTFDMIIEFYISRGIYDLFEINAALFDYDQVCLGC